MNKFFTETMQKEEIRFPFTIIFLATLVGMGFNFISQNYTYALITLIPFIILGIIFAGATKAEMDLAVEETKKRRKDKVILLVDKNVDLSEYSKLQEIIKQDSIKAKDFFSGKIPDDSKEFIEKLMKSVIITKAYDYIYESKIKDFVYESGKLFLVIKPIEEEDRQFLIDKYGAIECTLEDKENCLTLTDSNDEEDILSKIQELRTSEQTDLVHHLNQHYRLDF